MKIHWLGVSVLSLFCLSLLVQESSAGPLTSTDVFDNWTATGSPINGQTAGSWVNSGTAIVATNNHVGALVSDVTAFGLFSFSADSVARDNDTFGLMWGYQDNANHYRFSWAIDYGETGVGASPSEGFDGPFDGFKIIKEVAGVSSVLFSSDTEYLLNRKYNLSVSGTATGFQVVVKDTSTLANLFNVSVNDTTFTTGKVGFHELFQANGNVWDNFNLNIPSAPVPEPASFVVWVGLAGIAQWRRKRQ
ncbi:MAG: hypothetical protein R3C53_15855 [Pirellulaceae bacterium]